MREDARRIVIHHFDVRHERGTGVHSLEEIVGQERVLGYAPLEGGHERVHVVEPLAGEAALVEQILVHIRDGGGVGVHAGMAGVGAGEERARRARHRHADAGLQDAVALRHATEPGIDMRTVQRMLHDTDELLRRVPRQTGVGVERDAVPHGRQDVELADLLGEARVRCASQQAIEFLDLSALALPADPRVLTSVPLPFAMEEIEAIGVFGTEPRVEGLDPRAGGREHRRIPGQLARGRVGKIAEDREVDARIQVSEREHLEMLDKRRHSRDAGQHRRHDHHRAGVIGNALRKVEARQAPRRYHMRCQTLDE